MRRKSLIAALLLPLPFAALPVLAVFVSHMGGDSNAGRVAINPVPIQQQLDETGHVTGHTLAHNVADPANGCPEESLPPAEG